MIQCTARGSGDIQCARERGHHGPHAISVEIDETVAPFIADAVERLEHVRAGYERARGHLRLATALTLIAAAINVASIFL